MRILITGATGLIGSQLLSQLPKSWVVYAASRHRGIDDAKWIYSDLSQEGCCDTFPPKIDAVVHLAQSAHYHNFPDQATDLFSINVNATQQLLEYARRAGAKRFVMTSTGSVYQARPGLLNEESPWAMKTANAYARSKMAAELLANAYREQFPVIILRPFFVYGVGQKPNMLIPRLIRSVVEGGTIYLQGERGLQLNPIAAPEAAAATLAALYLDESTVVNVAGPEVLHLKDLCTAIADLSGVSPRFELREGESPSLVADISKMRELLVTPQVCPMEGLASMIPVNY